MNEFELIRQHFTRAVPDGVLGVGDDCALLPAQSGAWAVSTDLLLEDRHFFADVSPERLGHKALAVNLSDLAAMGAAPRGCVLGLALPSLSPDWLTAFSTGWFALAEASGCPLVGGDTTRASEGITISVTVFGQVDPALALRRSAASAGHDIWVSGTLGAADVALQLMFMDRGLPLGPVGKALLALSGSARTELLAATRDRLELPTPRLALGRTLLGVATSAIDVSDGLLQDLSHILTASHCGAVLQADQVPLHPALAGLAPEAARMAALGGGDVYELCFTAPPELRAKVQAAGAHAGVAVTRIGIIVPEPGLTVLDRDGHALDALPAGFDHFA